jgi:hypothetical protein
MKGIQTRLAILLIIVLGTLVLVVGGALIVVLLPEVLSSPTPVIDVPVIAVLPSSTATDTPLPPTFTPTPSATMTPSMTYTRTATWTPYVIIVTYTPTVTYTPSETFTPSNTPTPSDTPRPPTFTPTVDQPAPVVLAVAPDASVLVTELDPNCAPITTRVTANIESSVGLYTIRMNYTYNGQQGQVVDMRNEGDNLYTAGIGPFTQPGRLAYWLTMSDNWGKWAATDPQEIVVEECDLEAIAATATAAYVDAQTATAVAEFGGAESPLSFRAADRNLTTPHNSPITVYFDAINGTRPFTFLLNTTPANGTITVIDGSTVTYTPNGGYIGEDTFTYVATDINGLTDIGIIRINVTAPTPITGRVVYASDVNSPGTYDVYTINADGTGLQNLTNRPGQNDLHPSWSNGAAEIVYQSGASGSYDIYKRASNDTSGATETLLTSTGNNIDPSWSPSGSYIAFASDRDDAAGVHDIFIMNTDGTGVVNLTNSPGVDDRAPEWSPDSLKLAYQSGTGGSYNIFTRDWNDTTGASQQQLSTTVSNVDPSWSADGTRIVFSSDRNSAGSFELYSMLASNGSDKRRLTINGVSDRGPIWTTDNDRLFFYQDSGSIQNVYWMNQDGSSLTSIASGRNPDWTP